MGKKSACGLGKRKKAVREEFGKRTRKLDSTRQAVSSSRPKMCGSVLVIIMTGVRHQEKEKEKNA